jgi:phage repressor protein C with HTH and peptisase S24 domain
MTLATAFKAAGWKVIQCSRPSNHEVVAFVDCGGRALTSGIYVYTMDAFGRPCLFIKRIEPLADGSLKIISDNHHYETFTLNTDEQKEIKIHGRVVASLAVRRFV